MKKIMNRDLDEGNYDMLWSFHWRLRDEAIFRSKENRHGGYYKQDDMVSKLKDIDIEILESKISDVRNSYFGSSDT